MKKQLIAAGALAGGLLAAGYCNAALINIGTGFYSTTIGAWTGNVFEQQDKLWTLISDAGTNLDPATVVNFSMVAGMLGADTHSLAWIPVVQNATRLLHYTIEISPAGLVAGQHFVQATIGVDTANSCPTNDGACSTASKLLNGTTTITAYQGAPTAMGVTMIGGTFIDVQETAMWNDHAFNSVSNTFAEVPEPASLSLLGLGLGGLAARARARARKS